MTCEAKEVYCLFYLYLADFDADLAVVERKQKDYQLNRIKQLKTEMLM